MTKQSILAVAVMLVSLASVSTANAQNYNPAAPAPPVPPTAVQQAGGPAPAGPVEPTAWGIPMPKITLPKVTMPDMASVTAPMKSGFGKMKAGSKKAWDGAKEMLSFTKNRQTTVNRANSQPKQSFWKRLIDRNPEPQVPQTVGEFMRQPRLDP